MFENQLIEQFAAHLAFSAESFDKGDLSSFVEFEGYCFSPAVFEELLNDFFENCFDSEQIGVTMEQAKETILSYTQH